MKKPKLNDNILWKGEPAKIIGFSDSRAAIIELHENAKCPHCQGDLGKDQRHSIVSSPDFQENAKPIQTMEVE